MLYIDIRDVLNFKRSGPCLRDIGIKAFDVFVCSGLKHLPFWSRERANARGQCAGNRFKTARYKLFATKWSVEEYQKRSRVNDHRHQELTERHMEETSTPVNLVSSSLRIAAATHGLSVPIWIIPLTCSSNVFR